MKLTTCTELSEYGCTPNICIHIKKLFTTCIRLEHGVIVRQLKILTVNGGEHFEKNHCLVLDYFLGFARHLFFSQMKMY